jgi:molybdopterin-containing oxidoreductase family membrane subunit
MTPRQINRDLLGAVLTTPAAFWLAAVPLAALVALLIGTIGYLIYWGIGVTGLNRPVMWGVMITNFVFWVGISHAGVMISAILRLSKAEWRRPITRAAEVLTLFSLATAGLFAIIHTGRPWRTLYWLLPYDFNRNIWPNVRSALIWDFSAIITYLVGTALFVYVALLPDLAVARDHTTGRRRAVYGALALGFRGTQRQWRLQHVASLLLSALILPVFVSVHSIVSWDFAVALVPAWHSTVFAPYFVIGAVHSGLAAMVMVMAVLRWCGGIGRYLSAEHFDAIGRLQIAAAVTWLFFFWLDLLFGLYGREADELAVWQLRLTEWPIALFFALVLIAGFVIPVPLWLVASIRRSPVWMFVIGVLVNIALWFERYLLIVTALVHKHALSFSWGHYVPTLVEVSLTVGSFALAGLGILLFAKFFPIVPIFDIKESQVIRREIRVGKRTVPGVLHE